MKQTIKEELLLLAEPQYREFSKRLLPGTEHILGVRLPKLRAIALSLAREKGSSCLSELTDDSFEEIMLQGMVIGYLKENPETLFPLIEAFVPKIDNWSVCDSFCSGLKQTRKFPAEMWDFLKPYLRSQQEFQLRFAVVMLLDYYISPDYLTQVLSILEKISHPGYYVKMAVAWAVSICYIKYPEETLPFLKQNQLDAFTYKKSLQKITESRVISKEQREMIRQMMKTIH